MASPVDADAFRDNEIFQHAVRVYVRRMYLIDGSLPVAEEVILPVLESVEIPATREFYKYLMQATFVNAININKEVVSGIVVEAGKLQENELNKMRALLQQAHEVQNETKWIEALLAEVPDA